MTDSRQNGTTAELAVATKLNSMGYTVSWPLSTSGFDLIATKGSTSRRVQVKSSERGSSPTYRIWLLHGSGGTRKYTSEDCNSVIIYLPYHEDYPDLSEPGVYVIPISVATKTKSCSIYPPGKGSRPHWVSKWEKYREAWRYL